MPRNAFTASAIISFAEDLEASSEALYERLAGQFEGQGEVFKSFVKGAGKSKQLLTRTYRETISDALEACFSFADLDLDTYTVDAGAVETLGRNEALALAADHEEKAIRFYDDAAEQSGSLMATLPMAFRRVAKTRRKRLAKLRRMV